MDGGALIILVKAECSDDTPLVKQATAGDREAFRELIERHEARIAKLAQRLSGYRNDVQDIVQDVFVIALENIHRFRAESSFLTWLTKLTISRCRRERMRRLLQLNWQWHFSATVAPGADEIAHDTDQHQQVRDAIAQLPLKLREVVVLRYLEEMDPLDICHVLSLSRSALDVRLHRAREQLRKILSDDTDLNPDA